MAEPFSKEMQLARGPKRPARVKASREEWRRIREAKLGTCRLHASNPPDDYCAGRAELHHAISRARGGGDVADNILPLCTRHHFLVTGESERHLRRLAESLTDDEYAHLIDELGEGALERLFGVMGREETSA